MSDKNLLDLFKKHFTEDAYKLALEANGLADLESPWIKQLSSINAELTLNRSDLIGQWETLSQSKLEISDHLEFGESPLEILQECLTSDNPIIPHPAILLLISRQFTYYMLSGGDISLEEAFFGSAKGKGSYASRDRSALFPRFHYLVENEKPRRLSQEGFLEDLIQNDSSDLSSFNSLKVDDIESFLRKYRRWKIRHNSDK